MSSPQFTPSILRGQGYTERIEPIEVRLIGKLTVPQIRLSLTAGANITNRVYEGNFYGITAYSYERFPVATGRVTRNTVVFDSIEAQKVKRDEGYTVVIEGLRIDAEIYGGGGHIGALLEVLTTEDNPSVLCRDSVIVASIQPSFAFSVERVEQKAAASLRPLSSDLQIHSGVAYFIGLFPGALTTREQEDVTATNGTLLAMFIGVREGFRVFTTVCELPFGYSDSAEPLGKVVRVKTQADGSGPQKLDLAAELIWNDRTPMIEAENGYAAWQIVSALAADRPVLKFGWAVVGPASASQDVLSVTGTLAPFFTTTVARSVHPRLPVPRFIPSRLSFGVSLSE